MCLCMYIFSLVIESICVVEWGTNINSSMLSNILIGERNMFTELNP